MLSLDLRDKLLAAGVPSKHHNFEDLKRLIPAFFDSRPPHPGIETPAEVLIYLIGKSVIQLTENQDLQAFLEHERQVNFLIGNTKILANCTYSANNGESSQKSELVKEHQKAFLEEDGWWQLIDMPFILPDRVRAFVPEGGA